MSNDKELCELFRDIEIAPRGEGKRRAKERMLRASDENNIRRSDMDTQNTQDTQAALPKETKKKFKVTKQHWQGAAAMFLVTAMVGSMLVLTPGSGLLGTLFQSSDPAGFDFSDQSAYEAFGLNADPNAADFNANTDPLSGMPQYDTTNLYLGYMNKNTNFEGNGKIFYPLAGRPDGNSLSVNNLKITNGNDWSYKYYRGASGSIGKEQFEPQVTNAVAFDYNGDGIDEIFESTLYTGKYNFNGSSISVEDKRTSSILFTVYTQNSAGKYEVAYQYSYGAGDDGDCWVWDINADQAKGLVALAAGDFDGDGKDEVAAYIPRKYNPWIGLFKFNGSSFEGGSYKHYQEILLKDLDGPNTTTSFGTYNGKDFSGWRMPIVHLASSKMQGYNDATNELIINASLPMDYEKERPQNPVIAVFKKDSGEANMSRKFFSVLQYGGGSYRMRFASAAPISAQGGWSPGNGDIVAVAGYKNIPDGTSFSSNLGSDTAVGKLMTSANLVNYLYYHYDSRQYRFTSSTPTQVASHRDMYNDSAMIEPVALAAGSLYPGKNHIFIEGILFEGDAYIGSAWSGGNNIPSIPTKVVYTVPVDGNTRAFISDAHILPFSNSGQGTSQLVYYGGDLNNTYSDVKYDIGWIWPALTGSPQQTEFNITGAITDNNYVPSSDRNDHGTGMYMCPIQATQNVIKFKFKEAKHGWSAPTVHTVMMSPPYWKDLGYDAELFGKGATSVTLSSGTDTGHDQSWNIGGGIVTGGSVLVGIGLLGTGEESGIGVDFEAVAKYSESHYEGYSKEDSETYKAAGGEDYVLVYAVPRTDYTYEVSFPDMVMTQDMYNVYVNNGFTPPCNVGETIKAHTEDMTIAMMYPAIHNMMSIEEYNEAAEENHLEPLRLDKIFPHTPGLPHTYPTNIDFLSSDEKETLFQSNTELVKPQESVIEIEFEEKTTKTTTQGVIFDASLELKYEVEAKSSVFAETKVTYNVGGKVAGGYDERWEESTVTGTGAGGELAMIPPRITSETGGTGSYNFDVQFVTWTAKESKEAGISEGVHIIGYVVNGHGWNELPAPLPEDLHVDYATQSEVRLVWNKPEDPNFNQTSHYRLWARSDSAGDFTQLSEKISANSTNYTVKNLNENTRYEFMLQAVRSVAGGSEIYSARTPIVSALTKAKDGPQITEPPEPAYVVEGDSATFSVKASADRNLKGELTYQWQVYEREAASVVGKWVDVRGGESDSYTVHDATTEMDGQMYRVIVTQEGGNFPKVYSRVVSLWVGDGVIPDTPNVELSIACKDGAELMEFEGDALHLEADSVTISARVTDKDGNVLTNGDGSAVYGVYTVGSDGEVKPLAIESLYFDDESESFTATLNTKNAGDFDSYYIVAYYMDNASGSATGVGSNVISLYRNEGTYLAALRITPWSYTDETLPEEEALPEEDEEIDEDDADVEVDEEDVDEEEDIDVEEPDDESDIEDTEDIEAPEATVEPTDEPEPIDGEQP